MCTHRCTTCLYHPPTPTHWEDTKGRALSRWNQRGRGCDCAARWPFGLFSLFHPSVPQSVCWILKRQLEGLGCGPAGRVLAWRETLGLILRCTPVIPAVGRPEEHQQLKIIHATEFRTSSGCERPCLIHTQIGKQTHTCIHTYIHADMHTYIQAG